MKAIMVMFDSLQKNMLPPYGGTWAHAPNFERLATRSVTFTHAFAGRWCLASRWLAKISPLHQLDHRN